MYYISTSYEVYIFARAFYRITNIWIRQEHIRLEADKVQNGKASRNDYENSKGEME